MQIWSLAQTRKLLQVVDDTAGLELGIQWNDIAICVRDMRTARGAERSAVVCDPSPSDFRRSSHRAPQLCRYCGPVRFRHLCTRARKKYRDHLRDSGPWLRLVVWIQVGVQ